MKKIENIITHVTQPNITQIILQSKYNQTENIQNLLSELTQVKPDDWNEYVRVTKLRMRSLDIEKKYYLYGQQKEKYSEIIIELQEIVNTLTPKKKNYDEKLLKLLAIFEEHKNMSEKLNCMFNQLALLIIKQAQIQVANNNGLSLPYVLTTINMINKYPIFLDYFMANLYNECPYIIPWFPLRNDMDERDYKKNVLKMRYSKNPQNEYGPESEGLYHKKMNGIIVLYVYFLVNLNEEKKLWDYFDKIMTLQKNILHTNNHANNFSVVLIHTFYIFAGRYLWEQNNDKFMEKLKLVNELFLPNVLPSSSKKRLLQNYVDDITIKNKEPPIPPGFNKLYEQIDENKQ